MAVIFLFVLLLFIFSNGRRGVVVVIIIDNLCITLLSGLHKLRRCVLRHFPPFSTLSEKNIKDIVFKHSS